MAKTHARNGYATTGFCLRIASVFMAWVGIVPVLGSIFSAIGLAKARDRGNVGRVQSAIGLGVSILCTLVSMNLHGVFR